MKLIPYYRRTFKTTSTEGEALDKFRKIIDQHAINNFPEKKDFVGGEVKNKQLTIFQSNGAKKRPFPVKAFGSYSDGHLNLTFRTNMAMAIYFALIMGFFIYLSVSWNTYFYVPILIIYYVSGVVVFSKEAGRLENFIKQELESN